MATTSPDNLFSPNPTDNYNLIADWATSMQSVQTALTRRANMYVGTSAQRNAFTTALEGVHWQDTDGQKREYVRQGSSWVDVLPPKPRSGVLSGIPTGTLTAIGTSGVFATTLSISIPYVTSAGEYIRVSPLVTGTGYGILSQSSLGTVSGSNTVVNMRFMQVGNNSGPLITVSWDVVGFN